MPKIWYAASAMLHVIFVMGTISTLWSNHFRSWASLTQQPSESAARLIESGRPVYFALVLIGAVALGVTSAQRLRREHYRPVGYRFAAVAFVPILVELTSLGVQDGSPNDLNLLAPHSLALLAVMVTAPLLLSALDLRALRTGANSPAA